MTKEHKDFIINLSTEMKTQNNRGTAQPFALTLTEEHTSLVPEGYGDDVEAYWNESRYDNIEDLRTDLEEYYFDNESSTVKQCMETVYDYNSLNELKDTFEADILEINIQYIETKDIIPTMNTNFFLTEKAYHEHIRVNGHNLNKPKSWGIHLFRNEEMSKLYEVIHSLAEELKEKESINAN